MSQNSQDVCGQVWKDDINIAITSKESSLSRILFTSNTRKSDKQSIDTEQRKKSWDNSQKFITSPQITTFNHFKKKQIQNNNVQSGEIFPNIFQEAEVCPEDINSCSPSIPIEVLSQTQEDLYNDFFALSESYRTDCKSENIMKQQACVQQVGNTHFNPDMFEKINKNKKQEFKMKNKSFEYEEFNEEYNPEIQIIHSQELTLNKFELSQSQQPTLIRNTQFSGKCEMNNLFFRCSQNPTSISGRIQTKPLNQLPSCFRMSPKQNGLHSTHLLQNKHENPLMENKQITLFTQTKLFASDSNKLCISKNGIAPNSIDQQQSKSFVQPLRLNNNTSSLLVKRKNKIIPSSPRKIQQKA